MLICRHLGRFLFMGLALSLAACGVESASRTSAIVDSGPLPNSIHGYGLPLGERVGVVLEITSGVFGVPDAVKRAAKAFSDQVRVRDIAINQANGRLMFVGAAIDASAAISSRAAAQQIADQDAAEVNTAVTDVNLDAETVRRQVVLFFNDSDQQLKRVYSDGGNPTVAVIDATGANVGIFDLPNGQANALAALDRAQAE